MENTLNDYGLTPVLQRVLKAQMSPTIISLIPTSIMALVLKMEIQDSVRDVINYVNIKF
jgi:hypothetical protein